MIRHSICEVATEHLSRTADGEPDADTEGLLIASVPLRGEDDPCGYNSRLSCTEKESANQKRGIGLAGSQRSQNSAPDCHIDSYVLRKWEELNETNGWKLECKLAKGSLT